ncbi:hypothetical protein BN946_scf184970.g85 [Trametes cinnabarina]|uniref:SWI/SNF and RSC complexes subunit Ssr4 N-terminal domain-containing protein n=1 Tax=Pycnoporus cinnabarinus TaxID=5643 RepID=A0A060SIH9_PYCCI|nr:hypothetical protein BN946_scf184970.g85 [Trametes cinnabarina]
MPQLPFPIDGLVYLDRDQRYNVPIGGGRELEVVEVKYGFIPGIDTTAYRVRRRYRLAKGGHPQLVLIHYCRGPPTLIPSLDQPTRNYPLRPVNEPAVYVLGEKQGQKVFSGGGPGAGRVPPAVERAGTAEVGMGYGIPGMGMPSNPQALLAHQNSSMEALEKRALRRSTSIGNRPGATAAARGEDDDSADESETISTRTLALTRYRRNHEYMNEVFMYAAFGDKDATSPPAPYSIFKKEDLDEKVAKLNAEIEELKTKAAARKEALSSTADHMADVSMDGASAFATTPF